MFVNITYLSIHYYLHFAYILGGLVAGNKSSRPNMVGIYAIPGAEHAQHHYIPSASSWGYLLLIKVCIWEVISVQHEINIR